MLPEAELRNLNSRTIHEHYLRSFEIIYYYISRQHQNLTRPEADNMLPPN